MNTFCFLIFHWIATHCSVHKDLTNCVCTYSDTNTHIQRVKLIQDGSVCLTGALSLYLSSTTLYFSLLFHLLTSSFRYQAERQTLILFNLVQEPTLIMHGHVRSCPPQHICFCHLEQFSIYSLKQRDVEVTERGSLLGIRWVPPRPSPHCSGKGGIFLDWLWKCDCIQARNCGWFPNTQPSNKTKLMWAKACGPKEEGVLHITVFQTAGLLSCSHMPAEQRWQPNMWWHCSQQCLPIWGMKTLSCTLCCRGSDHEVPFRYIQH